MKILSLISLLITFSAFAETVRLKDVNNFAVSGTTNASISLNVDGPNGDATSESAPARVYLPIRNTNLADHDSYFTQNSATINLFDVTSAAHVVYFPLTVAATQTVYLYTAAKVSTGTGYKIIQKYSSAISSNQDVTDFGVYPKLICDQYTSDCAPILPTATSYNAKVTFKLYFFVSTSSNLIIGDTADPNSLTGGIFIEVPMSNRIYQSTDLKTYITDARKGDGRAVLSYTADNPILDFKKVIVFKHDNPTPADNLPLGSYTGSIVNIDFPANQSGDLTVNGLTNETDYTFSVAFVDKFGFATTLSADRSVTPVQIQELLKKQACYILTAGFGEEHYVTNYFRSYRDHVLAHSWFGRLLIKAYYRSAPHYALIIYHHEVLRVVVRGFAYLLYFLFNYGAYILIAIASCVFLDNLRKNKIFIMNNRL